MSFFLESSISRSEPLNSPSRRNGRCRRRRVAKPMNRRRFRRWGGRSNDSKEVLRRLQALKELIPSIRNRTVADEVAPKQPQPQPQPQPVGADRIFEDAAGYILQLKMQVEILRDLVYFYGPKEGSAEAIF